MAQSIKQTAIFRKADRIVHGHSATEKSRAQHFFRKAGLSHEISKRHLDAIEDKSLVRAPIVRLFSAIGPPAVAWFVVSIVIRPAINRAFGWRSLAHICKKILECSPAPADLNPELFIVGISRIARLGAASQHASPRRVRGRHEAGWRMTMLEASAFDATARENKIAAQAHRPAATFISAIASTNPLIAYTRARRFSEHHEHSKSLADHPLTVSAR